MNNFFRAIGASGHHEKRRRNERPERQLRCSLFVGGKYLGRNLGGYRYATQFLLSSSLGAVCSGRGRESKLAMEEYKVCTRAQQENVVVGQFGFLTFLVRSFSSLRSERKRCKYKLRAPW